MSSECRRAPRAATEYEMELTGKMAGDMGARLATGDQLLSGVGEVVLVCAMRLWPDGVRSTVLMEGLLEGLLEGASGHWETRAVVGTCLVSVLQIGGVEARGRRIFVVGHGVELFESRNALPWWALADGVDPNPPS